MKYEAILFDLDGTLLPMDNDAFTKGYFKLLCKAVAPLGYTPEKLIETMWKGVAAMVKNEGDISNYEAFWQEFEKAFPFDVRSHIPYFDAFYSSDFNKVKELCFPTEKAKLSVELARKNAQKVVLATNPFFPPVAVEARIKWAGLDPDDFDYITTYENSSSCKPNPYYYKEIGKKLGLNLENCLMIGNNADEDIKAGLKAGLKTFLLDDWLIAEGEIPETPRGNFDALLEFLK